MLCLQLQRALGLTLEEMVSYGIIPYMDQYYLSTRRQASTPNDYLCTRPTFGPHHL